MWRVPHPVVAGLLPWPTSEVVLRVVPSMGTEAPRQASSPPEVLPNLRDEAQWVVDPEGHQASPGRRPVILLDPATARDVLDAFRLLEGRLSAGGRRLSPGARELLAVAECSLRSLTVGLSPPGISSSDTDEVDPHLLTLEDCKARLNVGLTTIKAAIRDGQLRAVHLGRAVRVHSEDLAEYMDRLRKDAAA